MVRRRRAYYIGLLAVCVATRLASTIYYVEDTDSLRFALSVAHTFDVANLQPHFPGYPVFWAAAKVLFWITGSFAVSFSLIGGIATFGVACIVVRLSGRDPLSREGLAIAFVVLFSPMIWLMGNRYMPDLMGLAVALAALLLLLTPQPAGGRAALTRQTAGGFLTGLLAGTRLSYTPLLLPAYLFALRRKPLPLLAGSAAGIVVWLIPMAIDTGFHELIGAATRQTGGHFTEFGGTIETNPDILIRTIRLFEAVWADGFGAWWPGRHWLTLLVAALLVLPAILGAAPVTRPPSPARPSRSTLLLATALTYTTWIFFFQNIIYKSRHVLPLVALLAIPIGLGLAHLVRGSFAGARARRGATTVRFAAAMAAIAYAAVALVLVVQHRQPTAIAQVRHFAEELRPDVVASIPLVNYYLSAQGLDATYLSVQNHEDRERIARAHGKVLVVGRFPDLMPPNPARVDTFYHNPYVNRMWPEVEVYVYDR